MSVVKRLLTLGHGGTARQEDRAKQSTAEPYAAAPLCEVLYAMVFVTVGLNCGTAVQSQVAADESAAPLPKMATSWPLGRGSTQADGVAKTELPDRPEVLWKVEVDKGAFEGTPVIAGGVVYLGDMDGKVYAWNLADGKERWTYKVESGFIAAPAIRGDLLYIGDIDGKFYALDIQTGQPKWTFAAGAEIDNGANFWQDNVLFGSQDANLYCLNAKSGELLWKYAIGDQIRCMPTVVGDRSFVAGCDSTLHIIDLVAGKEAAAVPIEAPTGVTPAVFQDNVYFGTEGGAMFAVNWKEAKVAWKAEDQGSSQPYRSAPAVQEGIVVVGSRNRRVLAFDPATGAELWSFATKQRIDSSPVIVGQRVFVGAADGRLYAIDLMTGKPLWEYQATGGFTGSPAVADGKLVIATDRGVVYCFGKK